MTIIQVITELTPAGAERIVANLSISLKSAGHNITVVSLKPLPKNRTIVDELFGNNIPIFSLNLTKLTPWRILRLKKILKFLKNQRQITNHKSQTNIDSSTHQPIIVHSHLIHANLATRIAKIPNNNFKLINTIHIAEKRKSRFWHFWLDRLSLKYCDQLTAVSQAAADFNCLKLNIPHYSIKVIENGIKVPRLLNKTEIKNLREEWNLQDCSKVIGSVGRLNWQKGYDIFLKMLPELSKKIPENETWGIVILGEGKHRKDLEDIIGKTEYKNIKVILPGYRPDAANCISAFDLFIMPSRYEGHPLTLLEAVSTGIPIVANNIPTIEPIMKTYNNGNCIEFDNKIQQTLNSIIKFIPYKRQKTIFQYSIEKMTSKYEKLYDNI